jgi:hypothetical protein
MRSVVLTLLLLGCAGAAAQTVSKAERDEGFVALFDGKSFAGWQVTASTPKSWKVDNGLLVLTGGSSNLYTQKEYTDFVVRLQWRPAKKGYNSGLFIRGNHQINLAQSDCGRLFGSKGTRPVPELHKPPGEWNEWEVSCVGPKVTLKVNGKLAWSIDDFKPRRGPLGLQAEGQHIDFRNLRVREVKSTGK